MKLFSWHHQLCDKQNSVNFVPKDFLIVAFYWKTEHIDEHL